MTPSRKPLTPAVLYLFLSLVDGPKHGYGIMKEIEAITNGRVKMGPGTLYGTIKRTLASSLIQETGARPDPEHDDERRRYYELTALGRDALAAETRRLSDLVLVARRKQLTGVEGSG